MVMGTQAISPYQQVIEKTKNLSFRSQMLVMNVEKKLSTKDQEVRRASWFPLLSTCFSSCFVHIIITTCHTRVPCTPQNICTNSRERSYRGIIADMLGSQNRIVVDLCGTFSKRLFLINVIYSKRSFIIVKPKTNLTNQVKPVSLCLGTATQKMDKRHRKWINAENK